MIPVKTTRGTLTARRTKRLQRLIEQHERLERRLVRAQSLWQASRAAIRRLEAQLDRAAREEWELKQLDAEPIFNTVDTVN